MYLAFWVAEILWEQQKKDIIEMQGKINPPKLLESRERIQTTKHSKQKNAKKLQQNWNICRTYKGPENQTKGMQMKGNRIF